MSIERLSPAGKTPGSSNGGLSTFRRTVTLRDWWLTKIDNEVEGTSYGVAGLSSEIKPLRQFSSAPIVKRYDLFTLETADGICVILIGFINKSQTMKSGFSSEIFSHFLFGFPPCWEECAEKCLEGPGHTEIDKSIFNFEFSVSKDPITASRPIKLQNTTGGGVKNKGDDVPKVIAHDNVIAFATNYDVKENATNDATNDGDDIRDDVEDGSLRNDVAEDNLNDNAQVVNADENTTNDNVGLDGDTDHVEGDASQNFGQHFGFDDIPSEKETITLDENLLSCCMEECPQRMGSPEHNQPHVESTKGKLKAKKSISLAGIITESDSSRGHTSNRSTRHSQRKLNINQRRSSVIGCSVTPREENHAPETSEDQNGGKMKKRSSRIMANRSLAKLSKNILEKCVGSKKQEIVLELEGCTSKKRSVLIATNRGSNVEEIDPSRGGGLFNSSNAESKKQIDSTMVERAKGRNATQTGMRKNNSKKQATDVDTAPEGGESSAKLESSSRATTKRKINFDTYASPVTKNTNGLTSVLSPETLKRSRSGRLLLPTLEFWRNQVAVYDVDRQIIGIQEDMSDAKPSRGTKSEPPKKRTRSRAS